MAYNRLIMKGTLPGGEVWSSGISFIPGTEGGPLIETFADLLSWATTFGAYITGLSATNELLQTMSTGVFITSIRTELLNPGPTLFQAAEFPLAVAKQGGLALTKSYSDALVFSLLTPLPGRSRRGRMYWPALGAVLDGATGRVVSATNLARATRMKELIHAAQAATPGAVIGAAVWSEKLQSGEFISKVAVGDVLDTQRRRRDALVEQYQTVTY